MDQFLNEPKPIDEFLKKLQRLSMLPETKDQNKFNTQEVDSYINNECRNLVQSLEGRIMTIDETKYAPELQTLVSTHSNLQVRQQEFEEFNKLMPNYQDQINNIKQRVDNLEKQANSVRLHTDPQKLNGIQLIKAEMLPSEKSQILGMTYAIKIQFINQQEQALHNISLKLVQNPNVTLIKYDYIGAYQTVTQLLNIEKQVGEMIYQGGISFCGEKGEKVDINVPYYAKVSNLQFYDGYCSVMVQNTSFIEFNQQNGLHIYVQGQAVAEVQYLRPLDYEQEILFSLQTYKNDIEIYLGAINNNQIQPISNIYQQNVDEGTLFIQMIEQESQQLQISEDIKMLYKSACTNLPILKDPKWREKLMQDFYGCTTVEDCWQHVAALCEV